MVSATDGQYASRRVWMEVTNLEVERNGRLLQRANHATHSD